MLACPLLGTMPSIPETRASHSPLSFIKFIYFSANHCERLIASPMTVDTATRIDLHSAEVVHFTHKSTYDSYPRRGSSVVSLDLIKSCPYRSCGCMEYRYSKVT